MPILEPKIPGISLNHIVPTPSPELLTGVPVFFGLASGAKEAKKLTLATQFEQYFPNTNKTGYLGDAVKGFFF